MTNKKNKSEGIDRQFLGWERPLLLRAVKYLIDEYIIDGNRRFDLSSVVLAFPVHRAIPRFEEILVEEVNKLIKDDSIEPDWYPPELITLGSLPEKFYEQNYPIANDETQYFAWQKAILNLQNATPETLQQLLPFNLNPDDLENGIALGKILAALHYELVSENIDFDKIAAKCKTLDLPQESKRWQTLNNLKNEYHNILDQLGIWDLQSARLFAVNNQNAAEYDRIYASFRNQNKRFFLVGLVDMNVLQRALLRKFSDFVTALIFAPESKREFFDDCGCIVPDKWVNETVDIDDTQIEIVERSDFEAEAALRILNSARNSNSPDGKFAAGEISIVAANNETIPFFKRRFKEANIKLSYFKDKELRHTPVYRFLDLLSRFIRSHNFSDFAELVRHPDMSDFLKRKFAGDTSHYKLLSALDEYCVKFIPDKIAGDWKSFCNDANRKNQNELDGVIQKAWNIICELVGLDFADPKNIDRRREEPEFWLEKINAILAEFYQQDNNRPMTKQAKEILKESLEYVAAINDKINKIPKELLPPMTIFETINFQLAALKSEIISASYYDVDSIDLIGWLEAAMDDAELLIISGLNDGFIPSFVIADPFLPDKIRVELNILDNKRRYARDLYAFIVTINTRQKDKDKDKDKFKSNVYAISSRSSLVGDPLIPGRLFFATDDKKADGRLKLANRVKRFFGDMPKRSKLILAGSLEGKLADDFMFTEPKLPPLERVQKMRVTEFADYVRCPYRYYLKQRLNLFPVDDSADELSPSGFGNLVHTVLCEFGNDESIRDADNSESIKSWIKNKLYEIANLNFGERPRVAVTIQIERAAVRLEAFAKWQAERRKNGNKILKVEFKLDEIECKNKNFLDVDGEKMFLTGRIDRIDYNEKNNEYTIIDYKTANNSKSPEEVHKKRNNNNWLDFQLPLYYYILKKTDQFSATINLAYVNLPKSADVELKKAKWNEDELNEAIEQAREIVRNIWANNFKLTYPPPIYSEDYAPICLDNIPK
ncbi:MAG: PD-(D/E)XK nuclease family protein [Planctomycetaceae bacterium]|jgi:CRISPR/Cas system-associated exonuclease Cas4 (RecB family)|nr:PD-(D/E)XK nuclease family protein [Planctomycetaceae bacterium]